MKKRTTKKKKMKRGYSKQFKSKSLLIKSYNLDKMPATLYRAAQAQSKRTGVSIRAYLLQALTDWVEAGENWAPPSVAEPTILDVAGKGIIQQWTDDDLVAQPVVAPEDPNVLPPVVCQNCQGTGEVQLVTETGTTTDVCPACDGTGMTPATDALEPEPVA